MGVIGPQSLHSAVNLSQKSLSELLHLHKEYHSLYLFSIDEMDVGLYIGLHSKPIMVLEVHK